jgi:hypothetical protein
MQKGQPNGLAFHIHHQALTMSIVRSSVGQDHQKCGDRSAERDQGAAHTDRRGRCEHELTTIPRRDELRHGVRQGIHDALLYMRGRGEMSSRFGDLRHALPELDVLLSVAATDGNSPSSHA